MRSGRIAALTRLVAILTLTRRWGVESGLVPHALLVKPR